MKTISNIVIIISIVLSVTSGYAQIKNPKTENVTILGNCGMCKTTIEKAGNLKNVASVTWDKDNKMVELTFDSKKTNRDEILKRIALEGYDSDEYLAPDNAYAQLAGCCQYERQKKEPIIPMDHSIMEMTMPASEDHTDMAMSETVETYPLAPLFSNYFALKDALVKTNAASAAANSSEFLSALKELKIESLKAGEQTAITEIMPSLMDAARSISVTEDIAKQREKFKVLSKNMRHIIPFYNTNETLYYQYCPMQDANWLSKEKAVKNPYYGSQMLSCGSVVETVNSKD